VIKTYLPLRAALAGGLLLLSPALLAAPKAQPAASAAKSSKPAPQKTSNAPKYVAPAPSGAVTPEAAVKAFLQAQKAGDDIKAYSYFSAAAKKNKNLKDWLDQTHQVRQTFSAITLVAGEALLIAGEDGSNAQAAAIKPAKTSGNSATVEVTRMVPIKSTLYLTKENGRWVIDIQKSLLGGDAAPASAKQAAAVTPPAPPKEIKPNTPPPPPDTTPQCLSNLREVGTAFRVYALDHGGRLPDAGKWVDEITPYLSNPGALKCPPDSTAASNYAMNSALSGMKLSDVSDNRVLLYESSTTEKNVSGTGATLPATPSHASGYLTLMASGEAAARPARPVIR
jgi:hypothetical protein